MFRMLIRMRLGKGYPLSDILLTFSALSLSQTMTLAGTGANDIGEEAANISNSPSFTTFDSNTGFKAEDRLTNVAMRMCDSKSQQRYADFSAAYLDPPCEKASQGYCGIRKNQNYTLVAKFRPKVATKELFVRVTSIDPSFGWETPVWPEFSVCSEQFNITCPQSANNLVQAFIHDTLPEGFPSLKALVRVRLLGTNEFDIKRVYVCRELNLQVY